MMQIICKVFFVSSVYLLMTVFLPACANKTKQNNAYQSYVDLAMVYLNRSDLENAKISIDRAEKLQPTSAQTYHLQALYAQYSNKNAEAETIFKKLLKTYPDFGAGQNNYGYFLAQQGNYDDAIKYFRLAAENPQYERRHIAWMNLGNIALEQKKTKLALDAFEKAVKIEDNNPEIRLRMATIYYESEDWLLASVSILRYIELKDYLKQKPTIKSLNLGLLIAQKRSDQDTIEFFNNRISILKEQNLIN